MSAIEAGVILRGKYRIERTLGAGGMGVVVLATHLRLNQLVAIKVLRKDDAGDESHVAKRFAREARIASRLRSEHAVRILDVDDSEDGEAFLVMEYLEGSDLERLLTTRGSGLGVDEAVGYVLQACDGIAEAHGLGIVHRDLKPANLFLTKRPDGTDLVKLLDFGISKALEPEAQDFGITRPQAAIGSPSYMSPEQLKDAADVDARTDIWSLGVVLYQLLARRLPFEATTTAALAARIAADAPASLRLVLPELDEALERVILRCLEKDANKRFANVLDLADAIAPFTSDGASRVERTRRAVEEQLRAARPAAVSGAPPDVPAITAATTMAPAESAASPLIAALGGETAASMTSSAARVSVDGSGGRPRGRLALGALAVALLVAAGITIVHRPPAPPTTAASAAPSLAPSERPSPAPSASVPLAPPVDAGQRPPAMPTEHLPAARRPREVTPSTTRSARNPMDLDFR